MKSFEFIRPTTEAGIVEALAAAPGALVKAGGVDTLDRMKEGVDEPTRVVGLVDVRSAMGDLQRGVGTLRVGALVTLARLADSSSVRGGVPSLAEAARQAASPQIRNVATVGGNLLQHTRCGYYRHRSFPCLKRGDDVCPARQEGGVQETGGVFANDPCASAHPSSLAPVFCSLGAVVHVAGPKGVEPVPIREFYVPPEKGRAGDTRLAPGEVIVAVECPAHGDGVRRLLGYAEIRQKAAFDWALVSCAVNLVVDGDEIKEAAVWLGSVAPTPHHAGAAEDVLRGRSMSEALAAKAADAAVLGATPLPGNAYKLALVRVAVKRALLGARGR